MKIINIIFSKIKFRLYKLLNRDKFFNFINIDSSFIYDETSYINRIKENLINTNKKISSKKPRIFIAVKNINWEKTGLVDSWKNIAEVIHYDWGSEFDQNSPDWEKSDKSKFNKVLLETVTKYHKKKSIDIFFSYLSGNWVFRETIESINKLGIITVNFSFDDSHSFWGRKIKSGWSGNAGIADAFDACITVMNVKDILKYDKAGARPIYLPPGGNQNIFGSVKSSKTRTIPVSFIGQKYGLREDLIKFLENKGVEVFTAGIGWDRGSVSQEEMLKIYNNSLLTIGFGYLGNTTNVGLKGRDFEVPMTGAAYITTYNELLAEYFEDGKEIIFYKNKDDLLEKIKYYLNHQKEAIEIGINARKRSLAEHAWEKRWMKILDILRN
jgi:hypothetical protein